MQGNLIGTDWTGTLPLGNTGAGVLVDAGSSSNTIGGPVGGARNVISGNAEGIEITGTTTTGTDIAGNLIGTDITGQICGRQPERGRDGLGRIGHHDRRPDVAGPERDLGQQR